MAYCTSNLKTLAFIVLFCTASLLRAQTSVWQENFSDSVAVAAQWVNGGVNPGPVDWDWTTDPSIGEYEPNPFQAPTATNGFMWFNSDGNGASLHDVWLAGIGKPANTTGYNEMHIRFFTAFAVFDPNIATARVGISTNGGSSYTYYDIPEFESMVAQQLYEGWIDVAVPAADNSPNVIVQFRYGAQNDFWWKIDDISLYSATPQPVPVTFQVNMAGETVAPSGVFVAGVGPDIALSDQGNGIWSATVNLLPGTLAKYQFKNGLATENLSGECGVYAPGGNQRMLLVRNDAIELPAVCFGACTECVQDCAANPLAIICDGFEDYSPGSVSPQSPWWSPVGVPESSVLGAEVTNTLVYSGINALHIRHDQAGNEQGDRQMLLLGNRQTGKYRLEWYQQIPQLRSAFVALLNDETGSTSNAEIRFDSTGLGGLNLQPGGSNVKFDPAFTFTSETWLHIALEIDLDIDLARMYVDGQLVQSWVYSGHLGALYFGAPLSSDLFAIDNLSFVAQAGPYVDPDLCASAWPLDGIFTGNSGVQVSSPLFDNTGAQVYPDDPQPSCFTDLNGQIVNRPLWFRFEGTGSRYKLETGACNATDYIDFGDTQMAVFTGENCGNLTQIACSEDFSNVDYRAVITELETTPGQTYFVMIDGWAASPTVVATGEYCIQGTKLEEVSCAAGAVGSFSLANNGNICPGAQFSELIVLDSASFALPTAGPVSGMAWAVTSQPVLPNVWPGGAMIASTPVTSFVFEPNFNVATLAPGTYFLTPIVMGGVTDMVPGSFTWLNEVNPTGGCFFIGESMPFTVWGAVPPLVVTATVTDPTNDNPPNGAIALNVAGGSGLYSFTWTSLTGFSANTQQITGIGPDVYTVTIYDQSGCTDPVTQEIALLSSSAGALTDLEMLELFPNPVTGATVRLDAAFSRPQNGLVSVYSVEGRLVWQRDLVNTKDLHLDLPVMNWETGVYWVQLAVESGLVTRKLVRLR